MATKVAVKIVKLDPRVIQGDAQFQAAAAKIKEEAEILQKASDGDFNEYVVKFFGVASGVATQEWLGVLGIHAASLLLGDRQQMMVALVMGYEGGGNLDALLHNPTRPWIAKTPERLRLVLEIATGLFHLHNNTNGTIIHGDLKPENVLLSGSGKENETPHVRLADFGFSKLTQIRNSNMSRSKSASGARAAGTDNYMAPEMYQGTNNEPALDASRTTDIFALGVLMWEVLSDNNRIPWEGVNWQNRLLSIRQGQSLDLTNSSLKMDVSQNMRDLIRDCLSVDRLGRPDIRMVRSRLEEANNILLRGQFDVFLSYAWGSGNRRQPLANEVYNALRELKYRVWIDQVEMGQQINGSMLEGIRNSRAVVILLSPDYAASNNCMTEIRETVNSGKPYVICMVEPGFWRTWVSASGRRCIPEVPPHEILRLGVDLVNMMYVDFAAASTVDWAAPNVGAEDRKKLTERPEALPRLRGYLRTVL